MPDPKPHPVSRGLPIAGSVLAIVTSTLLVVGGVVLLLNARGSGAAIITLVLIALGVAGIVLGALGCMVKPGPLLANAILFSLLDLLFLFGLVVGAGVDLISLVVVMLTILTTVFLWVGFAQARHVVAARAARG